MIAFSENNLWRFPFQFYSIYFPLYYFVYQVNSEEFILQFSHFIGVERLLLCMIFDGSMIKVHMVYQYLTSQKPYLDSIFTPLFCTQFCTLIVSPFCVECRCPFSIHSIYWFVPALRCHSDRSCERSIVLVSFQTSNLFTSLKPY